MIAHVQRISQQQLLMSHVQSHGCFALQSASSDIWELTIMNVCALYQWPARYLRRSVDTMFVDALETFSA